MVWLHQSFTYCSSLQTPAVLHPAQKQVKLRDEIASPVASTPGFTLCMDLVPGMVFSMFAVTVLLLRFNGVAVPLDVQQRADSLTAELSSKASQDFSHLPEHPLIAGLPAGTTSIIFMWEVRSPCHELSGEIIRTK